MIAITNPEKYTAGLYERLSNEKIEVGNGEVIIKSDDEKESGSISTQKLFLRNFCKDNKISIYDDYTDDGYSGATFDRPDFNRMIQDIENKKINLILVKDLSRLGRLSSKISYYLEEYFIEKGVRFIAITDDIDTGHIETSDEMVQFKAFFNEWFLRDTSRKVRNGKKARARDGKIMATYPTYRIYERSIRPQSLFTRPGYSTNCEKNIYIGKRRHDTNSHCKDINGGKSNFTVIYFGQ